MNKKRCPKGNRECKYYATEEQYPKAKGLTFCQVVHMHLKDFKSCPEKK